MALHGRPISRALPAVIPAARKSEDITWAFKPKKRALLVGINEYARPGQDLEGCVNDVFLMSALLQESGFAAEDIRIVLNNRATHQGVRERLEWLLEDAKDGDVRFFYYSGHGAQLPGYGLGDQVDRLDETLVLHDFDWTPERAFTDDDFYALYSQLPYELRFVTIFDCCHSGSMARAAISKVRGVDPPDDIRHRMLRWDPEREMWVEREIESPNPQFERKLNSEKGTKEARRCSHRLGQAMDLRASPPKTLKREAAARGHKGPFLPVLIYASREEEFSFEYQHGSIAHGAFTYCLAKTLRRDRHLKNQSSHSIRWSAKSAGNWASWVTRRRRRWLRPAKSKNRRFRSAWPDQRRCSGSTSLR
jgi:metacaspase-1